MKNLLVILALIVAAPLMAQQAAKGYLFTTVAKVQFGTSLHDYMVLTHGATDTTSNWINLASIVSPNGKPGVVLGFAYRAKATTDTVNTSVQALIESRYCDDPSFTSAVGSGCDSIPTYSGATHIYSTQKIIDTLQLTNGRTVYVTNKLSLFDRPLANQMRIRLHIVRLDTLNTWTGGGFKVLGH